MGVENKVIWHEGLFLQPQHLQQHDRYFEYLLNYKQKTINKNLWGFSELVLDKELLSIGKIGILSAAGIFSDGTTFNIPRNDDAPAPFAIPEGLNNTILYLAVPLRQSSTAEAGSEKSNEMYRYTVVPTKIKDAIADSNEITEVPLGSLACRILSEQDDLSNYTCLPIVRIKEARSNNQITFDQTFITSWLDAHQESSLEKFIQQVHVLLNSRAEMLAGRLSDTQQAGSSDIVDLILLQLSNRYELIFRYFGSKHPLHPELLYYTLIQLLAEMATFTNNKRRPIEPPTYQHEDLYNTFKTIINEVRHALSTVLEQNATQIQLESRGHGLLVGMINDKGMLKNCSFILAAYADIPLENLRTSFPTQVKIGPVEQIRTLVSKALPGVPIQAVAVAPRQIPYHANFCYFALNTHSELWSSLEKSAGIALHIGSNIPGIKLELWAIKG
jgi:type VI secretion system protein ImpJ